MADNILSQALENPFATDIAVRVGQKGVSIEKDYQNSHHLAVNGAANGHFAYGGAHLSSHGQLFVQR